MDEGQSEQQQNDFSEYMWMEDLENFDKEMTTKIAEEDYIRSSIELLLEEEERSETIFFDESGHGLIQEQHYGEPNTNGIFNAQPHYMESNNMGLNNAMENLGLAQQFQYQPMNFQQPRFNNSAMLRFPPHTNSFVQPENRYTNGYSHYNYNENIPNTSLSNQPTFSSKLNPDAKPFTLNPEAREFVPKSAEQ